MDVAATQTSQTASASAASQDRTMINSDFQTFLTMLTTQMQNQDPLNPMESTEFATQLATFSGVEQQVRTNELLGSLQDSMALSSMGQIAGWIGMDPTSGLLCGEGHIPLAATPHFRSAAPVAGVMSFANTDFHFDMSVTRIDEKPRICR